eukprot:279889_1
MAFAQFLMDCFNVFRDKLDKGQHAKKSFPQHKRFGIFVDRRESGNKHQVNEVTLFQQLASCDTIPAGSLDEWYIQAVRDCIIPGIDEQKQSQRCNQRITAQENVNGQLLTFSFNVETEDQIKCYIIWNGQTMRFKGDNLGTVFSYLFVESSTAKKEHVMDQFNMFDTQVMDREFEGFCEQINSEPFDPYKAIYQTMVEGVSPSDAILDAYLLAKEHKLYKCMHDDAKSEVDNQDLSLYTMKKQCLSVCEAKYPSIKEELLHHKTHAISLQLWN